MKKLSILILIFIIVSCKKERVKTTFTPTIHQGVFVKGIINLLDNSVVLLQEQQIDKSFKTIQTTQIKDSYFEFKATITEEKLYYIGFNTIKEKTPFIANKYNTYITIDTKAFEDYTVEGTVIQKDYNTFLTNLAVAKNKFSFKTAFINKNPNSILSGIILKGMLGKTPWRLAQNKKLYKSLSLEIQNTILGKEINQFIINNKKEEIVSEEVEAKGKIEITEAVNEISTREPEIIKDTTIEVIETESVIDTYRNKAPNFYAESIKGNDISLKSILKNNKVVLVDFWASWCGPCRAENPNTIQLYNKYHSKGFDVIGVSEDKFMALDKWKNAVKLDGLPWHQVIDDNKRVAKMFGVSTIPHMVLLDQNGGIILEKSNSYTVGIKLKEIFGF